MRPLRGPFVLKLAHLDFLTFGGGLATERGFSCHHRNNSVQSPGKLILASGRYKELQTWGRLLEASSYKHTHMIAVIRIFRTMLN